jgi:hypothetical protein
LSSPPQAILATPNPSVANDANQASNTSSSWLDWFQEGLGWAGMVSGVGVIPDTVNTGIYALRGNFKEAGFSAIAIIPIVGDTIAGGRKIVKAADKVGDLARQTSTHADDLVGTGKKTITGTEKNVKKKADELTGQFHHPLSAKITKELAKNKNISQEFKDNYHKFRTQALDKASHNGYEKWHRELDDKIVNWLKEHDKATEKEFIEFLKKTYKASDLAKRFPEFSRDFDKWLNSLK